MLISIDQLTLKVFVGVHEAEQRKLRSIPVDIRFDYEPGGVDDVSAAVDYEEIRRRVLEAAGKKRFRLIETLAKAILDAIKRDSRISSATVVVHKPGALHGARSVSVSAEWRRA